MPASPPILPALRKFADTVTAKMSTLTAGEPEDQLRAPKARREEKGATTKAMFEGEQG